MKKLLIVLMLSGISSLVTGQVYHQDAGFNNSGFNLNSLGMDQYISGYNFLNHPTGSSTWAFVQSWGGWDVRTQTAFLPTWEDNSGFFIRTSTDGGNTWAAWVKFASQNYVSSNFLSLTGGGLNNVLGISPGNADIGQLLSIANGSISGEQRLLSFGQQNSYPYLRVFNSGGDGTFRILNSSGNVAMMTLTQAGIATFSSSINATGGSFSGNVGIGTSSPGPYMLAVEGVLGARKIKVTQANPWADYVFDKEYHLDSLSQVELFIKKNKHLPGVPTAKEVEKDGVDVGETEALLLKKIEELTLYMIEQNKKITQLNLKVEEQQNEIVQLNKSKNRY
jgi:hypothetical protein